MSVVITGASGVVGREVFKLLTNQYEVVTVGKADQSNVHIDLTQKNLDLTNILKRPDFVIHLAAAVPKADTLPDDDISASATLTMDNNVYNACHQWQCHVIYASGCSLYQPKGTISLRETDALRTDLLSPYLRAKALGDAKFRTLEHSAILRLSTPVGGGLSPASVLGKFLIQLSETRKINVFGTGSREQNYIDVRDIAAAVKTVIQHKVTGAFNIASENSISMLALAKLIIQLQGYGTVSLGLRPDPLEGSPVRYSITKTIAELNWKPLYSIGEMLIHHRLLLDD